ncbi:MAG: ABC transporter permease, partial [Streptomycetaceae bacterium]|nr:ABC transporter permease [Streptomycetaceae bacterium]
MTDGGKSAAKPAVPNALRALLTTPVAGPLVALLLACVFFANGSDQFLSGSNFSLILQQVMVVGT